MKFEDISGLHETKDRLIQAVRKNRAGHSQLFFGYAGSPTLPMTLAYASYLHCEQRSDKDSCGVCPACRKNEKYIHPDTHFIFPLSSSDSKPREESVTNQALKVWRRFLLENPFGQLDDWIQYHHGENKYATITREQSKGMHNMLYLKPIESEHKIIIVWMPERLHTTAAHGILKLLEEPPPHSFLLFVTADPEKLLSTITSRMQTIHIPLLQDEDIDSLLKKRTPLNDEERSTILRLSNGNLTMALQLSANKNDSYQDRFADWMRACYKKNYSALVATGEYFHGLSKLHQQHLLSYGASMMREALLCLTGATMISRIQKKDSTFIHNFSRVLSVEKIEKISRSFSKATRHLEQNGSPKMIFMCLSLDILAALCANSQ